MKPGVLSASWNRFLSLFFPKTFSKKVATLAFKNYVMPWLELGRARR